MAADKKSLAKTISIFVILPIIWVAFSYWYFGSILPQTFQAKAGKDLFFVSFVIRTIELMSYPTGLNLSLLLESNIPTKITLAMISILLSIMCVWFGYSKLKKIPYLCYAMYFYPWVMLLAYAVIGAPVLHKWQVHSMFVFYAWGVLSGLFVLTDKILSSISASSLSRNIKSITITFLIGCCLLLLNAKFPTDTFSELVNSPWHGKRHLAYESIISSINSTIPIEATIGVHDIGIFGYYLNHRLIDLFGLVTPFHGNPFKEPEKVIQHFKPDYLLLFGEDDMLSFHGLTYRRLTIYKTDGFYSISLLQHVDL